MSAAPHLILGFHAYVEGDKWPFTDAVLSKVKLPLQGISGQFDRPEEFIIKHGDCPIGLLSTGLKPAPDISTGFVDEKIKIDLVEDKASKARNPEYLFDQKIVYQEALIFVASIVANVDRIVFDITADNLAVCGVLRDHGLLILPEKDPIGKEAIHYL